MRYRLIIKNSSSLVILAFNPFIFITMILHTYKEEEILKELIEDYKEVKRNAKKRANKYLSSSKQRGRFIREDEEDKVYVQSSNNNQWFYGIIYNQTQKVPWKLYSCCIVEGEKNTKEYYVVRGLNTESPYFVKFTSHTLKRIRERNFRSKTAYTPELLASICFKHRETAVAAPFAGLQYIEMLRKLNITETPDDMSYMLLTEMGVFYGYITDQGNYLIKTFISPMMGIESVKSFIAGEKSKWDLEGNILCYMILLHQYYNKSFYDEDVLENMLYYSCGHNNELVLKPNSKWFLLKP